MSTFIFKPNGNEYTEDDSMNGKLIQRGYS